MSNTSHGRVPYTVRHRTSDGDKLESCFYASDAFEARLLAMEFNAYIKSTLIASIPSEDQRLINRSAFIPRNPLPCPQP